MDYLAVGEEHVGFFFVGLSGDANEIGVERGDVGDEALAAAGDVGKCVIVDVGIVADVDEDGSVSLRMASFFTMEIAGSGEGIGKVGIEGILGRLRLASWSRALE